MNNDGRLSGSQDAGLLRLATQTAEIHLETAKKTLAMVSEQLSIRTVTIASITGTLIAQGKLPITSVAAGVRVATEIMEAAEAATAKALELQTVKDNG